MKRHWQILLALAVVVTGCTARHIAEYDPNVDRGAAELQTKFNVLFDDLQRTAGTPDGAYERFTARYDDLRVHIARVQSSAGLQSKNEITSTSLALLDDNLQKLESAHRAGLTPPQVPVLRQLFDTQLRMLVQLETAKKRDDTWSEVTQ